MSFLLPLPLFQKKYTRCKWLAYVGFFPRRKTIFYAGGKRLPSGGQGGQGCSPGHRSAATKENETQAMASRASILDAFQTNPRTRTVCQQRFQSASACVCVPQVPSASERLWKTSWSTKHEQRSTHAAHTINSVFSFRHFIRKNPGSQADNQRISYSKEENILVSYLAE